MFAKCTINDITFIFICTFITNYLLQFAINQNATQWKTIMIVLVFDC